MARLATSVPSRLVCSKIPGAPRSETSSTVNISSGLQYTGNPSEGPPSGRIAPSAAKARPCWPHKSHLVQVYDSTASLSP